MGSQDNGNELSTFGYYSFTYGLPVAGAITGAFIGAAGGNYYADRDGRVGRTKIAMIAGGAVVGAPVGYVGEKITYERYEYLRRTGAEVIDYVKDSAGGFVKGVGDVAVKAESLFSNATFNILLLAGVGALVYVIVKGRVVSV